MSEYAQAKDFKHLIGKRARIKKNLNDYCAYLWGCVGTIKEIHGNLFLEFDKPAFRNEHDSMSGIYLTHTSFELIKGGIE